MRKEINWLRHSAVLFLTIVIFTVGVLIGGDIEQLRVQSLYTQLQEQDLDYQKILTEENYINYLVNKKSLEEDNISCETVKGAYFTSIENLDESRLRLEAYINRAKVKEEEYQRLRSHYGNLQISYWILANKINDLCPESNLNTILYFFSEEKKDCPACEDQGIHLTYVKQKMGDEILVFSLNSNELGPVNLLAQNFDVYNRELPVLVINSDEIYGYSTNEEVFEFLNFNG